jgi:predicted  nucleic acid-binding Zn-ribbon protein
VRILSNARQQKTYSPAWDSFVAEYVQKGREILALEAGIEEMDVDIEGAEEEIQQKEEELRRLREQLSELSQSADIPEEVTPENEDIPEDEPERS